MRKGQLMLPEHEKTRVLQHTESLCMYVVPYTGTLLPRNTMGNRVSTMSLTFPKR